MILITVLGCTRWEGFLYYTISIFKTLTFSDWHTLNSFFVPWIEETRVKNKTVCLKHGNMVNPHFTSLLFDLWITWINQRGRRMKRQDRTNANEAMHIYSGASLQKVRWPPKGRCMCEKKITGCPAAKANHLSPINSPYTHLDPLIFPHPHLRPKPSISPKQRRTEAFYNLLQVLVRLSGAERSNILSASLP